VSGVLVAYGTKHGSTAEIAEAIADVLRQGGHNVDCTPAGDVSEPHAYDAAVVGSAVYVRRWRRDARGLLKQLDRNFEGRPVWIFSSGPCGNNPDPSWSEPSNVVSLAEKLGARGHVIFGGRLPVEPSNFMERAMVNDCPPDLRDLRDWEEIRAWAAGIAAALPG
jgi:menaquinone-dependent protoporphyrinogen oxidase